MQLRLGIYIGVGIGIGGSVIWLLWYCVKEKRKEIKARMAERREETEIEMQRWRVSRLSRSATLVGTIDE